MSDAPVMAEWCDFLPGRNKLEAKYAGPLFAAPPTLVVLHRPAQALGVAEYFHLAPDNRKVSTHFAPTHTGEIVQCVSLRRVAWGQGGGTWKGNAHLNQIAVSVELPCPMAQWFPRSGWIVESSAALLRLLAEALPSLTECIGHVDCDPAHRRDPGDIPWAQLLDKTGWVCPRI